MYICMCLFSLVYDHLQNRQQSTDCFIRDKAEYTKQQHFSCSVNHVRHRHELSISIWPIQLNIKIQTTPQFESRGKTFVGAPEGIAQIFLSWLYKTCGLSMNYGILLEIPFRSSNRNMLLLAFGFVSTN